MTQRIGKQGTIKYALSGDQPFVAAITPGETVTVECVINIGDGVIKELGQTLTPEDVTFPFVNGATRADRDRRGEAGRHAEGRDPRHGTRQARLYLALAGPRHVPRLGASQGMGHPDPGGRRARRFRPLERHTETAGEANGGCHRRGNRSTGPCSPSTTAPTAATSMSRR